MAKRSISDIIEAYLKSVLEDSTDVEIKRSEIAEHFECVPSQINYVINTRFTPKQGYFTESKRGGGGYIRIIKLKVSDEADYLDHIIDAIRDSISLRDTKSIIENLEQRKIITLDQAEIMYLALDKKAMSNFEEPDKARAVLLKHILEGLKYKKA